MDVIMNWVRGHSLLAMLSISTVLTFLWLLRFRERLRMNAFSSLVVSLLHVIIGVIFVSLFAFLENPNDYSLGLVSLFGGVFFMPIAYYAGARLTKRDVATVFDIFVVCLVVTLLCSRINCLISGCCLGRVLFANGETVIRWPTRELEVLFYIVLLAVLVPKVLRGKSKGELYPAYMIAYGIFRFVVETVRVSSSAYIFHLSHLWALVSLCIGISFYAVLHNTKNVRG